MFSECIILNYLYTFGKSTALAYYNPVFYWVPCLSRDTGVGILTGLDDIQQQLDDHILKSQTMRGSPYVKAFEADMVAWEEKLISMQDILDQWLMVSGYHLHLP